MAMPEMPPLRNLLGIRMLFIPMIHKVVPADIRVKLDTTGKVLEKSLRQLTCFGKYSANALFISKCLMCLKRNENIRKQPSSEILRKTIASMPFNLKATIFVQHRCQFHRN